MRTDESRTFLEYTGIYLCQATLSTDIIKSCSDSSQTPRQVIIVIAHLLDEEMKMKKCGPAHVAREVVELNTEPRQTWLWDTFLDHHKSQPPSTLPSHAIHCSGAAKPGVLGALHHGTRCRG